MLGQNTEASRIVMKNGKRHEQRRHQPGRKTRQRAKAHFRIIGAFKLRRAGKINLAGGFGLFGHWLGLSESGRLRGRSAQPRDERAPRHGR